MEELQEIQKQLEREHKHTPSAGTLQKLTTIRTEINTLSTQAIKRKFVYSFGYPAKCFAASSQPLNAADVTTGNIITHPSKIQDAFESFYKNLYAGVPRGAEYEMDDFLNSLCLPSLNEEQNKMMIAEVTEAELMNAINRLKYNKSPGSDGYTAEWYWEFKQDLIPTLLTNFNCVLKTAQMPPSWKEAIISAIPKEGKDKMECGSYRPISVLNIDYRLFISIMAKRMEEILPDLISNDQTGFIRRRQTQDNIRRTLHVIHQIQTSKSTAMLMSIDAEKAFDSVNWDFLYKVLDKFGLHKEIVDTVRALYTNPTARIKVNGSLSNSFVLQRGNRQGCAWSPLLFALYLEPLAQSIRQNKDIKGITIAGQEHKLKHIKTQNTYKTQQKCSRMLGAVLNFCYLVSTQAIKYQRPDLVCGNRQMNFFLLLLFDYI
uniref:Reverse transcriptase domain-containing protein n=1 Tax=Pundamilia nyererei TaxID=303518 RepID=A0A3B4H6H7_9CICH